MRAIVLLLLALAVVASAFNRGGYQSPRYSKKARIEKHKSLCFHLAVKHEDDEVVDIQKKFQAVSDPWSPDYGQHLTLHQLTALVDPSPSNAHVVAKWVRTVPVESLAISEAKDFVRTCMSSASAEKLLGTEFYSFVDASGHSAYRAVSELQVPEHVADKLDFIGGANTPIHKYEGKRASSAMAMKDPEPQSAVAQSTDPMAPHLTRVVGGFEEMSVQFKVTCLDGHHNKNRLKPCAENGVAVSAFEAVVITEGHDDRVVNIPVDSCNDPAVEAPFCMATIGQIRNYSPVSVKLRTRFSNGNETGWSPVSYSIYGTDYATPTFLKQLYGIPESTRVRSPKATQSIAAFLEQYYNSKDLAEYLQQVGVPDQKIFKTIGPNNETEGAITGGEAQLDVQVIMGVAVGAPTWFWSIPGRQKHTHQEPFLHWVLEIANRSDAPLVHSVSYGDDESSFRSGYIHRLDLEFMKMGLRGMTVVVASGDDGIMSGDREHDMEKVCRRFEPSYPASSPYVLSVGGTQLTDAGVPVCGRYSEVGGLTISCSNKAEKGCSSITGGVITTGGGFSDVFPRPDYQEDVVAHYLRSDVVPPRHLFNQSGRGYPDISAYSSNYITIMNGRIALSSGTSASCPLIAAMVTLWNDMLIQVGRPPLGFFNPRLYQIARDHPEAFNDVVTGKINCGIYGRGCCEHGYEATSGWDPVGGLGTPKFQVIANHLLNPHNLFPWVNGVGAFNANEISNSHNHTLMTVMILVSLLALLISTCALYQFRALKHSLAPSSSASNSAAHNHAHGYHHGPSIANEREPLVGRGGYDAINQ